MFHVLIIVFLAFLPQLETPKQGVVSEPMHVQLHLRNYSRIVQEADVFVESDDAFLTSGNQRIRLRVLPAEFGVSGRDAKSVGKDCSLAILSQSDSHAETLHYNFVPLKAGPLKLPLFFVTDALTAVGAG